MNAVHSRSDQEFVQDPLQPDWQPRVTMVEKGIRLKGQLISCKNLCGHADDQHLRYAKRRRHGYFSEMESKAGGNIQIRVGVMHVMKAPKEGNTMICDMPPKKAEIHQQEGENKFHSGRNLYQVNEPKRLLHTPRQRMKGERPDQDPGNNERQRRHCQIKHKSREESR